MVKCMHVQAQLAENRSSCIYLAAISEASTVQKYLCHVSLDNKSDSTTMRL